LTTAVRVVFDLLVRGDYGAVAALTRNRRLDAEAIERALSPYREALARPPDDYFDRLDVVWIAGSDPPVCSVAVDLWSTNNSPIDVTVELRLTRLKGDVYDTELLDIHTL
jgi:hypothetical protein